MQARSYATRWLVVALVIVAFALVLVAGCGNSDPWVGTWVKVDDENTGLEIEKKSDTVYNVHDPDGKNAFDATLSGDTLTGTMTVPVEGKDPVTTNITLTRNGEKMTFALEAGGQNMSWELKKK
jgi:hypothetical protein